MWTSLCNFFCDKFFSKHENLETRENRDDIQPFPKRLKLSDRNADSKDSLVTNRKFSMQAKENVAFNSVKNDDDDDDDGCFVIAEIPRRKKVGPSLNARADIKLLKDIECNKRTLGFKENAKNPGREKDNTGIEVIDCITSSSKTSATKPLNKNYKFFSTQRSSLSQSKSTKSRVTFKNHLKKKLNFLQESYRLTEKFQYLQLLQTQTTCNLLQNNSSKLKKMCSSPVIPVIDLTDDKPNTWKKESKSTKPISVVSISDDKSEEPEVQIVDEIPGIRSLEDMLRIQPVNAQEAVKGILSRSSKAQSKLLALPELKSGAIKFLDENDKKTTPETLEAKLRTLMQITEPGIAEVENKYEPYGLLDITPELEKEIERALVREPSQEILSQKFGLSITRKDMQTLKGLNWLNDEVINFYMNLIVERSKETPTFPKVYAFNTFFFTKLATSGYCNLRRWTKKVDIFSYDLILIPIHLGMHWCLSVIDFRTKFIKYYDSIGSPNDFCLDQLLSYLKLEKLDKKSQVLHTSDWKKANVDDIPQQMNGSDCGVFSCMFAEHVARDGTILFTQDDIPYFRRKMILEILHRRLMP